MYLSPKQNWLSTQSSGMWNKEKSFRFLGTKMFYVYLVLKTNVTNGFIGFLHYFNKFDK